MQKNEKTAISAKDYGSITNLKNKATMKLTRKNLTTLRNKFQYYCSFCWRTLPTGSTRFNGIGACPKCFNLAHVFVDALRGHRANYLNNLGVRK